MKKTKLIFYTYGDPKLKDEYYYKNSPLTDNSANREIARYFEELDYERT